MSAAEDLPGAYGIRIENLLLVREAGGFVTDYRGGDAMVGRQDGRVWLPIVFRIAI
jgi:Xaa-Pro aminopeptidase